MKIENESWRLKIDDASGAVVGAFDKAGRIELIAEPRLAESWRLLLPIPRPGMNDQANYILGRQQRLTSVEPTAAGAVLRWAGPLTNDGGKWDVSVTVRIILRGPAVEFTIEVDNRTELVLAEVWHAGLGGLMGLGRRQDTQTLLPTAAAARTESLFRTFPESMGPGSGGGFRGTEFFLDYPKRLSMPWLSLCNPKRGRGVYYGCHDLIPRHSLLRLEHFPSLARNRADGNWPTDAELAACRRDFPAGITMHWVHVPYLPPGEAFASPPVTLQAHEGDWHDAAMIYRQWFTSRLPIRPASTSWLRNAQAMLDVIFMLPEGNVIKTFRDIPALAAGAAAHGVDAMMVSGWWVGGHDNQYPDYRPDPRLGTWNDLARGIEAAHKLGVRVIFFANIQAIDGSTERYRRELHKYRVMQNGGYTNANGWGMGTLSARMGATAPPIVCCSPAWPELRRIIVEAMVPLARIGADGVHFDKTCMMGLDFNPACPLPPDQSLPTGVLRCIEETAAACRRVNPEFCIGVEASWDRLLGTCDAWWNWIDGLDHTPATKFAFPEQLPTFPVVQAHDFNSVNNAVRFGYQLLLGPARWSESLDDPQYRPLARYIAEVIRLRRQLADILYTGVFLDTLGASVEGPPLVKYSVFSDRAGQRKACVVQNLGGAPACVTIRLDGNGRGRVGVHEPFKKPRRQRLPVRLDLPPERFAVVVQDPV